MKKVFHLILLLFFITTAVLSAKSAFYTVKIGTFMNPQLGDFEAVRSLGYVYADKAEGELYQIYLGRFTDKVKAEEAAVQIKGKGYFDAHVEERQLEEGSMVTVVQIASTLVKETVKWDKYLPAGQLHTILTEDRLKVVVGPYEDVAAAKVHLVKLRKKGFADAFIKNVNSVFFA